VVLGDVEHRAGAGLEALDAIQLEARQLQHPDLRQHLELGGLGRRRLDRQRLLVEQLGHGLERRAVVDGCGLFDRRRIHGSQQDLGGGRLFDLRRLSDRRTVFRRGRDRLDGQVHDRFLGRIHLDRGIGHHLGVVLGLRHRLLVECVAERAQQRRADVAGHRDAAASALDQQRGHAGGGRLAVGAGDREHARLIAVERLELGQRLGEQFQLAAHAQADLLGARQQRLQALVQRRQAGALQQHPAVVDRGQQLRRELAMHEGGLRQARAQRGQLRRLLAAVPHRHARAQASGPGRHREPGVAQAEHERVPVLVERGEVDRGHRRRASISAASGWPGPPGTAAS